MAENEISITYETLFEILRLEKNRVELQKLDKDFYENVSVYIKDKTSMYNGEDGVSQNKKELHQKQLSNIKKIVKDIYFRRQKKIINMAFNRNVAINTAIETGSMLKIEKEFFSYVQELLKSHKLSSLKNILEGKMPEEIGFNGNEKAPEPKKDEKPTAMIRFIKDVPVFMGYNLEKYGPYKAEDMANLPRKLAKILVSKGSAEEINA